MLLIFKFPLYTIGLKMISCNNGHYKPTCPLGGSEPMFFKESILLQDET